MLTRYPYSVSDASQNIRITTRRQVRHTCRFHGLSSGIDSQVVRAYNCILESPGALSESTRVPARAWAHTRCSACPHNRRPQDARTTARTARRPATSTSSSDHTQRSLAATLFLQGWSSSCRTISLHIQHILQRKMAQQGNPGDLRRRVSRSTN